MTEDNLKPQTATDANNVLADSLFAKCSFSECNGKAEWVMGTWQCCDECAKNRITETDKGEGFSLWGTSRRIGQKNILAHNIKWNLKHYLVGK